MTAEAPEWVGRGIDIDRQDPRGLFAGHELLGLWRDLLLALGRNKEAVQRGCPHQCRQNRQSAGYSVGTYSYHAVP
jgi:hypothetical protein